jgi:hypothetical protein
MGHRITIFLLTLSIFVTLALITATDSSLAEALRVRDITAGNSTVWHGGAVGGEKIGNLTITFKTNDYQPVSGGLVNITAHVGISPSEGNILEGWLIDPDVPTYYNLTLGQFVNGTLNFKQYMNNPNVYKFFVVSQEPIADTDPRISNVILGGSEFQLTPQDIVGGSKIRPS